MTNISFDKLNRQQHDAVTDTEGPVLVLAGAGSGKTRVLTLRIAYIVNELSVPPYNILAVTFTNKAAGEIKSRLATYMGESVRQLWSGTFHSVCIRMLREFGNSSGLSGRFSIYDEYDREKTVKDLIKKMGLDQKKYVPRYVLPRISAAKDRLVMPEDYAKAMGGADAATIQRIYSEYYKYLRENNAYDFDDLIFFAVKMLQENKEAREHYQNKFRYIHVDEYQDINYSQYKLITLLAGKWKNVFCVGDDDQSIYGWRGADVSIILNFERDYPDCRIHLLEQNYRSTGNILKAADAVIRQNSERNSKKIWTENDDGRAIALINASDGVNEANQVCASINSSLSRNNASYGDFAILYRANYLSRSFEQIMIRNAIPYKIVGGTRFYEREEIKDMIGYLKVVNNPSDNTSLLRIINKPRRSIGEGCVSKLQSFASERGVSLFDSFSLLESAEELSERQKNDVGRFAFMIKGFIADSQTVPVGQLVKDIYEKSGLKLYYEQEEAKAYDPEIIRNKKANINEFISNATEYSRDFENPSLEDFLDQISLSADIDSYDDEADAVSLMTVHSAKGLEFPYVYIAGLEEGIFPHERNLTDPSKLAEERRLMYVAMTRAEKELTLSYADFRMNNGEAKRRDVSSFIKEISKEFPSLSSRPDEKKQSLSELKSRLAEKAPASAARRSYRPGTKVMHPVFGKGMVINCQGVGDKEVATVVFENKTAGLKKLLVHAAKMTVL